MTRKHRFQLGLATHKHSRLDGTQTRVHSGRSDCRCRTRRWRGW